MLTFASVSVSSLQSENPKLILGRWFTYPTETVGERIQVTTQTCEESVFEKKTELLNLCLGHKKTHLIRTLAVRAGPLGQNERSSNNDVGIHDHKKFKNSRNKKYTSKIKQLNLF